MKSNRFQLRHSARSPIEKLLSMAIIEELKILLINNITW